MRRLEAMLCGALGAFCFCLALWGLSGTKGEADTLTIPNKTFSPGGVIRAADHNANAFAIEAVVNGFLSDVNIKNASITGSTKLIDGTVNQAKLATGSVGTTQIIDSTIASVDISDGTIASADISDGTIASADIGDGLVNEVDLDIATAPSGFSHLRWDQDAGKLNYAPCSHIYNIVGNPLDDFTSEYWSLIAYSANVSSSSATEANVAETIMPNLDDLRASSMIVKVDAAPGGDDTFEVMLRKGGALNTAVTCTVATGFTTCATTAGENLTAGEVLDIRIRTIDGGNAVDNTLINEMMIGLCVY